MSCDFLLLGRGRWDGCINIQGTAPWSSIFKACGARYLFLSLFPPAPSDFSHCSPQPLKQRSGEQLMIPWAARHKHQSESSTYAFKIISGRKTHTRTIIHLIFFSWNGWMWTTNPFPSHTSCRHSMKLWCFLARTWFFWFCAPMP